MAYQEFNKCSFHAERHVFLRRKLEGANALERGSALVASMLAEGVLIDKALEPLKLGHLEKIEYVAKNSVFIKSSDGHEAIQIVLARNQIICIHRLLSKEFRKEFQAHWLGVWSEPFLERSSEMVVEDMTAKVLFRQKLREEYGVTSEIQFAASPAVVLPDYQLRY